MFSALIWARLCISSFLQVYVGAPGQPVAPADLPLPAVWLPRVTRPGGLQDSVLIYCISHENKQCTRLVVPFVHMGRRSTSVQNGVVLWCPYHIPLSKYQQHLADVTLVNDDQTLLAV